MIQIAHLNNLILYTVSVYSFCGSLYTAQDALSFAHVINTLYSCLKVLWTSNPVAKLKYLSYLLDCAIIAMHIEQWFFWIHHSMALFIAWALYNAQLPIDTTIMYMFIIELSNVFLVPFSQTKSNKTVNTVISTALAWTYIPLRSLFLPYQTYNIIQEIMRYSTTGYVYTLVPIFLALQVLSWVFSWKIFCIVRKKIKNNTALTKLFLTSNCQMWPVVTYIGKVYVTTYMMMWILPSTIETAIFVCCDVLHILVSWLYNLYGTELLERLDIIGIHTKIVVNGVIAYSAAGRFWNVCNISNIALLGYIVYGMIKKDIHQQLDEHKWMYISGYTINFVLSSGAGIFMVDKSYLVKSIIAYMCAGFVWGVGIPERWLTGTVWTSPGWMHLLVIAGDWWWLLGSISR
jgi:hypothetical protein